jgi:hypothetical protein
MRHNHFKEAYCHTASELGDEIGDQGLTTEEVYCPSCSEDAGSPPEQRWSAEIAHCESGETVCYVEGPSREAVLAIVTEVGLETQA